MIYGSFFVRKTKKRSGGAQVLCKKCFQDLLPQHIFFCQINFIIIYLVEITYYFEFLMVKLIYLIVLTHFFQFNQLKILRQPRLLTFLS